MRAIYTRWWRLGVALVLRDNESKPLYLDGKKVPQCRYEVCRYYITDWSSVRAKNECIKKIREEYGNGLVDIVIYNTEPVDKSEIP